MVSKRLLHFVLLFSIVLLVVGALPVLAQEPEEEEVVESTPAGQEEDTVITDTVTSDPEEEEDLEGTEQPDEDSEEDEDEDSQGDEEDEELGEDEIVEDDGVAPDETEVQDDSNREDTEGSGDVVSDEEAAENSGVEDEIIEIVEDDVNSAAIEEEEVVEDLVVEGEAGDISSQAVAIPGTFTTEYLGIVNIGDSSANDVIVEFFQGGVAQDTQTAGVEFDPIPAGGSTFIDISGLANGMYGGRISSGQPLAAGVVNVNSTSKLADAYLGDSDVSTRKTIGLIFRGHASFDTRFYVQNASNSAQTINIKTFLVGASVESPVGGVDYLVDANSTVMVNFFDSAFDDFGTGNGFYGYAVVEGTDNIAVVAENYKKSGGSQGTFQEAYIVGLNDDQAGPTAIAPLVYAGHAGWNTGFNIVNLEGTATTVTMNYTESPNIYDGEEHVRTVDIGPFEVGNFNMAALNIDTSFGGAEISSSATDILVVVNSNKKSKSSGDVNFATPAFNPSNASSSMAFPVASRVGGWNTGLAIYNIGSGNIKSTWIESNTAGPTVHVVNSAGTDGQVTDFNLAALINNGDVPAGFIGSVIVEAEGGGQTIIGIANNDITSQGYGTQMAGQNY